MNDDKHALDPSVEAFCKVQEAKRYSGRNLSTYQTIVGPFTHVDATGRTFRIHHGASGDISFVMATADLARDLADAINAVLMRHVAKEKPAHERVRDIMVDSDLPF